jgi:hypothetical protein
VSGPDEVQRLVTQVAANDRAIRTNPPSGHIIVGYDYAKGEDCIELEVQETGERFLVPFNQANAVIDGMTQVLMNGS